MLILICILSVFAVFAQPAEATPSVIVVPDDFPTINQAIQNASDGDTVLVRQGMYNETVVIDKAITLKGEDTNKTIINGNYRGNVIQIRRNSVTVTGLTILFSLDQNSAHRYYIRPPGNSTAYFVRHTGWEEGLAGIHLQKVQNCNITGNKVSDCGLGLWLTDSQHNTISGNYFLRNNNGLVVQTSWYNKIVGNTFLDGGAGVCLPPRSVFKTGLVNDQSSGYNTFIHNNFVGNQIPVESLSLVNATSNIWDDGVEGNYWSIYNGSDSDGNGVGDEPYQIMAEYYTGGYSTHGVWKEQVYSVDNYPLIEPFDTAAMFTVYQPPSPSHQPAPVAAVEPSQLIVVLAIFAVALAALAIYIKAKKR